MIVCPPKKRTALAIIIIIIIHCYTYPLSDELAAECPFSLFSFFFIVNFDFLWFVTIDSFWFVVFLQRADYVSGGELFTHLYQREKFAEDQVRIYIAEIIMALEHLHKVSIPPPPC